MTVLYKQDHVIYCDTKKRICVTVEQTNAFNNQSEKSLDISLTDESDLYFLFTVKIYASDYLKLKDQQGLFVEYNAFSEMLIDLLKKCAVEENNSSPRYVLQFSESSNPHVLQIVETTDFRHLTHLALSLSAATDDVLKAYLVSYIKKLRANYETDVFQLEHKEINLNSQLLVSNQMSEELKSKLEDFKSLHQRDITELKRQYESQLDNLKLSNDRALELLKLNHSSEMKALRESHIAEISGLRSKLESQSSLISTNSVREEDLRTEIGSLSKALQNTESSLNVLQKENESLKTEILSLNRKEEELQSTIKQMTAKYDNIESMFAVEQRRASSMESDYAAQRDQFRNAQEEIQRKTKQIEKLERHVKQQTCEVTKANSVIKQLQKDLKSAQNKAKLRGQVATEQEKVLTAKEAEAEEAVTALREAREQLRAEETRREHSDAQVLSLQTALEEAKKTIENNENIISWLNRQISESHAQSWQERLKAKGIPVPSYMADKQPPPPTMPPFGKGSGKLDISENERRPSVSLSPCCTLPSVSSGFFANSGLGTVNCGTNPAVLSRVGKEGHLLETGSTNNAAAAPLATNLLEGVTSGMAGLAVRSPAPLVSLARQQPASLASDSASKSFQNGAISLASDCESSLSRPPKPGNQNQHSSLLSSYFPQKVAPS